MGAKIAALVATAALVMGVALFAAPSTSDAVTISSISTTVGSITACSTSLACASTFGGGGMIWNLGATGTPLNPGDTLVLLQTGGLATAGGFNFDVSDNPDPTTGVLRGCNAVTPCTTTLTINGVPLTLGGPNAGTLANFNSDPGVPTGTSHNEATDYGSTPVAIVPGSFEVFFGYADNIHTDPCADGDTNCLPEGPFLDATHVLGAGGINNVAGYPTSLNPNHCTPSPTGAPPANCFDSGVILVLALPPLQVPEPSTLILLGTGLIGLAAYGRRHLKKDV